MEQLHSHLTPGRVGDVFALGRDAEVSFDLSGVAAAHGTAFEEFHDTLSSLDGPVGGIGHLLALFIMILCKVLL